MAWADVGLGSSLDVFGLEAEVCFRFRLLGCPVGLRSSGGCPAGRTKRSALPRRWFWILSARDFGCIPSGRLTRRLAIVERGWQGVPSPRASPTTAQKKTRRCMSIVGLCQWSGRESNPRPLHCERSALPTELPPRQVDSIERIGQQGKTPPLDILTPGRKNRRILSARLRFRAVNHSRNAVSRESQVRRGTVGTGPIERSTGTHLSHGPVLVHRLSRTADSP